MHELVVLQVHTHVRYAAPGVKEHQVALLQLGAGNGFADLVLLPRRTGQADAENIIIDHLGKGGAVDAFFGAATIQVPGAIPFIDQLEQLERKSENRLLVSRF